MLNYYVKLINRSKKGETGLSGTCESETDVIQKLQEDQEYQCKKIEYCLLFFFYAGEQTDEEMEKACSSLFLNRFVRL